MSKSGKFRLNCMVPFLPSSSPRPPGPETCQRTPSLHGAKFKTLASDDHSLLHQACHGLPLCVKSKLQKNFSSKIPFSETPPYTIQIRYMTPVQLFATPWTAACQASLSFTISRSLLKLMPTESVMSSNYLILFVAFSSSLQSFPALGSFLMSWLFTSGGQNIEASASVLEINIQG